MQCETETCARQIPVGHKQALHAYMPALCVPTEYRQAATVFINTLGVFTSRKVAEKLL
jgi:hypothetical protein